MLTNNFPECEEKQTATVEKAELVDAAQSSTEAPKVRKKVGMKCIVIAAVAVVVAMVLIIVLVGERAGIEKEIIGTWQGNLTWAGSTRDDYTVTVMFRKDKTGEVEFPGGARYSFTWEKSKDEKGIIQACENDIFGQEKIVKYSLNDSSEGAYLYRDEFVKGRLYRIVK